VAVGQAHRAQVEADVEGAGDQLRRTAADVEHERPVVGCSDTASRELRLLVAAQDARLEAVARRHLAHEFRAVHGIAHRARPDRDHPPGAELVELGPELRERRVHALHSLRREPAARIDADPEPGHLGPPDERLAVVGDEQARRVRPDVDDADARHLAGTSPVTLATIARVSANAARSTRAAASDSCRSACARSKRAVEASASSSSRSIRSTRAVS
jgi:hypothetical protein